MSDNLNENLFTFKRVMRALRSQDEELREAILTAQLYSKNLPYAELAKTYNGLTRDSMVVALFEKFKDTGLGGLPWSGSGFPTSLSFRDDSVALVVRKEAGLRLHLREETNQLELLPGFARIALLWGWPTSRSTDVLNSIKLQMFNGDGPLEESTPTSTRIPLLRNPEQLSLSDFNPQHTDQPDLGFDTGE